ncbi:uncharacterized protein EV420DRAFT_1544818 [Desarmillaria tabescens]|uniref:Uncharacterized protein n=1 Tax=Armillaria tabescens TaxID=1929756 RepID=A0AA39N559_ARMTA|nr:uncharacterized protein EV420DRAFT_1544818 [Desarmillaria tabescens]KAK0458297.1 hypothetical protein EV420DRAFT_1544818 [Desarmillaria tabescens]
MYAILWLILHIAPLATTVIISFSFFSHLTVNSHEIRALNFRMTMLHQVTMKKVARRQSNYRRNEGTKWCFLVLSLVCPARSRFLECNGVVLS